MSRRTVVVVGASVAGVNAVEELRKAGFDGRVVLVGAEPHFPYDRPPLSKQLLVGQMEPADLALRTSAEFAALDVELRLGVRATRLDVGKRVAGLSDGTDVCFAGAIVATGASARRLPGQPSAAGLHALRTLDDALALRSALCPSHRVLVIGAGFIGAEVASSAIALGCQVTVVEAAPQPMARVLGSEVGARFATLLRAHGADVLLGVEVSELLLEENEFAGIRLRDGRTLRADVCVVGVGARPNVDWLAGSELVVSDGLVCDSRLRAAPRIYGAGDVVSCGGLRLEHWSSAREQGRLAAANLVAELRGMIGELREHNTVPYFWSDQFGVKVQLAGIAAGSDRTWAHDHEGGLAVLFRRAGRLGAAMTWNRPAELARLRRMIDSGTSFDAAVAWTQDWHRTI